jgi:hypothetical protein
MADRRISMQLGDTCDGRNENDRLLGALAIDALGAAEKTMGEGNERPTGTFRWDPNFDCGSRDKLVP